MTELPKRKPLRLKEFDYSSPGAYFVTICTKDRKKILSEITVGDDALIVPKNELSEIGKICNEHILRIESNYQDVTLEHYVIMPNHIHLLILLHDPMKHEEQIKNIETIIRTFKTMVTKEIGKSIWQRSFHDHIIRNKNDYQEIMEYIDNNVLNWEKDRFY